MNAIPRTKIEKYWLDQFDANDIQAQLLVQRYSLFIKNQRSLQTEINKQGVQIVVKNGSQTFNKPNPLLKELRDLEKEIAKMEKELGKRAEATSMHFCCPPPPGNCDCPLNWRRRSRWPGWGWVRRRLQVASHPSRNRFVRNRSRWLRFRFNEVR